MSQELTSLRRWSPKLREKAGGAAIDVTMGDFADVGINDTFPLIYLPFNTLFALLTQERQVECFRNVASHLEPGTERSTNHVSVYRKP